ncbi:MAG: GntR family transcriptional regulator [Anaerolineales bacterium]|nr:GntR family transcriptional regulator [Anaerolineales bacterium]MCS7248119.1 GntR family transcriptional regulator [Anaerolineales bacterium]MDW8161931.1 GntR family transcriptional regulator [Anaerolineales bacterium]MDW8446414.1 GntR family transcriptional regulator [Anaerolineales bacterium]
MGDATQGLQERLAMIIASTPPGDRLPSEPELARKLGVSRASLREAMRFFETQGVIHRRPRAGTYVMQPPAVIETGLEVLESIDTLASRIGLSVSMGDVSIQKRVSSPEEASALGIQEGTKVIDIRRSILTQKKAVAYLIDIVPEGVISDEEMRGFQGSVLDLLLRRGSPPLQSSRCEINVVQANRELAKIFGIQRGDGLLMFKAWLYTVSGQVIDYSFSYFLPGYFRFHVVRRVGQVFSPTPNLST